LASVYVAAPAQAQGLNPGDAVVTRFSGVVAAPGGALAIDRQGPVAIGVGLSNPGTPAGGRATDTLPELFHLTADEIGQVFGLAIRPGAPAVMYFTASSAFGLHRQGGDWMPGQWGAGGGPGTVYRLTATPGARPEIFATITLDGRRNTGAALGNIAYDALHNQLFVSDFETGVVHSLDADDGRELGRYDHGVEGRPSFTDLVRIATGSRPAVPFDAATGAQIAACPGGNFEETPACWNIADFRRRVWGLGVFTDKALGETRLYYAVWSSQGFGNPDWETDPAEQLNAVWSVGIDPSGAFDATDVRLEFELPGFFVTPEDYARAGGSHPVADIAFSEIGDMLVAERGGMRNLGLGAASPFTWPHESRVLVFRRDENRIWAPVGRHDVGFSDRRLQGEPYVRANAGGGVGVGFGYDAQGRLDLNRPDAFVWMTGDGLCADDGPCFAANGTQSDVGPVNGAEGQPADATAELSPAAAFEPYPTPGPATPPDGPSRAYLRDLVDSAEGDVTLADERAGWIGDIEIAGAGPQHAPAAGQPDLAVTKTMPTYCVAGANCTAQISVTNAGNAFWTGPIYLTDVVSPAGPGFAGVSPPWLCTAIAGVINCYHPHVALAPGEARSMVLDLSIPPAMAGATLENCAAVAWWLATPNNNASVVRAVQTALFILGYNPGPIDGSFGPLTATAIGDLQAALGIPQTFAIDAELLNILFGGDAGLAGDGNPANDRDCATTTLVPPVVPPLGVHLPLGSFGGHAFPASVHAPIGSGPGHAFPASVHLPFGSLPGHAFPWSIHLPIGSWPGHAFPWSVHLPFGSGPGHGFPASIHLPLGSGPGHAFPWSVHLPIGSVPAHVFPWSIHLPIGSGPAHVFPASIHLPLGSGGGHAFPWSVHLPIGSGPGHGFPASVHLPFGSGPGHFFPFSVHLPIGSGPVHFFPWSVHLPIGSGPGHLFPFSIHLPAGSAPAHLPLGSMHLPIGSLIHLPFGSGGGIHIPLISGIGPHVPFVSAGGAHLPLLSAIGPGPHVPLVSSGGVHSPLVSGGGIHLPVGSGLHLPPGSAGPPTLPPVVHQPFISGLHLPIGSGGGPHLPPGSAGGIHLPVGSPATAAPEETEPPLHLPTGSQPIHLPPGSQPVHRPRGSAPQTHLPLGSQPTHLPLGSQPTHLPLGSAPTHLPLGSQPVHRPRGSAPQTHLPLGSAPTHLPLGSTQTHQPVGSTNQAPGGAQTHQPLGSNLQIHVPLGSRKVEQPKGTDLEPDEDAPAPSILLRKLPQ
jgi:hypothetical protein